tara:strand:- start:214 stop:477 length:264 start_codon:yes stop_codon:yes gene_type:complete
LAIKHGNKTYLQILLDPHRAELLMSLAEGLKVRPTSWIRDVVYKELERCIPSQAYERALEADKAAWQDSVRRRVEGRAKLKKDAPDS